MSNFILNSKFLNSCNFERLSKPLKISILFRFVLCMYSTLRILTIFLKGNIVMAESVAGAAEVAKGITQIAIQTSVPYLGGGISISINSTSAQSVRDVCVTAVTLGAIYAGYKLIAKKIDGAVSRGLGGERDDQEIRDIKPGSLHVLLHCFTDQRLLEVLEDFESGRMKERLEKEFSKIGIEVEGLKIGIDNIEEVKKRKEQMYGGFLWV